MPKLVIFDQKAKKAFLTGNGMVGRLVAYVSTNKLHGSTKSSKTVFSMAIACPRTAVAAAALAHLNEVI